MKTTTIKIGGAYNKEPAMLILETIPPGKMQMRCDETCNHKEEAQELFAWLSNEIPSATTDELYRLLAPLVRMKTNAILQIGSKGKEF